jgi:hypothetical protein
MLTAAPIVADIDSLGFGAESGRIQPTAAGQSPQVDVYQYDAPVTQSLDVRVEAQGSLQSATLSASSPQPSNVTTLLAPPNSNALAAADHSSDELAASTLPNPAGQAPVAAGFQGMVARMQQIVQPLVRGFDTLRGHLRTIVRSIFSMLSRPRVDSEMVSPRGAAGSQPDSHQVGLSAGAATMPDGRLELWDLALKSLRARTGCRFSSRPGM